MQIAADITINNSTFQHNQIMKLSNNSLNSYTESKTFHHNIKNWFQISTRARQSHYYIQKQNKALVFQDPNLMGCPRAWAREQRRPYLEAQE